MRRGDVVLGLVAAVGLTVAGCGGDHKKHPQRTPTPSPSRTAAATTPTPSGTPAPHTPTPSPSGTAAGNTPTPSVTSAASFTPTFTATPTAGGCAVGPVDTSTGTFCGMSVRVDDAMAHAYLGMPFGESTAGANRWAPPVAKAPGPGTIQATQFGAVCPQPNLFTPPAASEDCLSINVWTPASATPQSKLPVMVFIYGGAYIDGGSAFPVYDGAYITAKQDVLVVSFNYRLGALGFLTGTGGLTGNYGFLDQQLALKWVRDNIGRFGGDAAQVTIFGESAGAMSVGLHLLAAPESAGLFVASIMESNPLALPYAEPATAAQVGMTFATLVGCNTGSIDCLRNVSVSNIIMNETSPLLEQFILQDGFEELLVWAPIVDGTVITRQPLTEAQEHGFPKPTLLGTNRDEGTLFVYTILNDLGLTTLGKDLYELLLKTLFGDQNLAAILTHYPANTTDNAPTMSTLLTDYMFFCANRSAANGGGDGVYAYQFNQVSNFNFAGIPQCAGKVCHVDELPYVFHSATNIMETFTVPEDTLSKAMVEYWASVSRPGHSPNASGSALPTWPAFPGKHYLLLDSPITTAIDPPHNCDFWDGIGYLITPTPAPTATPTPVG